MNCLLNLKTFLVAYNLVSALAHSCENVPPPGHSELSPVTTCLSTYKKLRGILVLAQGHNKHVKQAFKFLSLVGLTQCGN